MKIAVCDDEQADLCLMLEHCRRFDPGISAAAFTSGEALLDAYKSDYFDLVFLDIEMERMNGLEVGKHLLDISPKPVIVFTTQSLSYAVRGYGIAIRYLPKPITYDTFYEVILLAQAQILPQKIRLFVGGEQKYVSVNEILYFEVLNHQLLVHRHNSESLVMRETLSEIVSRVPQPAFAQPHKSYYINMAYVDRLTQQRITMTNGYVIPIGRSKKARFLLCFSEYMREGSSL